MTTVAIDHDSTLAGTAYVAYELMHGDDHDYGDPYEIQETWDWPLEQFGAARFLSAMWHAWTLRPLEVPLLEDDAADSISNLREHAQVDIVSTFPDHMGIKEGKLDWLEHHGIEYDNFVHVDSLDKSKAALGYDYYVDDKPGLVEAVNDENPAATVHLYDHSYNRGVDGDYIRVNSLYQSAGTILHDLQLAKA